MHFRRLTERELVELKRTPDAQRVQVVVNMLEGLQCACGAVRVPYFGTKEGEHGTLVVAGVTHGYDYCR